MVPKRGSRLVFVLMFISFDFSLLTDSHWINVVADAAEVAVVDMVPSVLPHNPIEKTGLETGSDSKSNFENNLHPNQKTSSEFIPRILLISKEARQKRANRFEQQRGNSLNAGNRSEEVVYQKLGLYATLLENQKLSEAGPIFESIQAESSFLSDEARGALLLMRAQEMLLLGKPLEVKTILSAELGKQLKHFPEETALLILKSQVESGSLLEAFETFEKNRRSFFSRDGSPKDSDLLLNLALRGMEKSDKQGHQTGSVKTDLTVFFKAENLLLDLARSYPVTPVSLLAYEQLKDRFPSVDALHDRLWPSRVVRRKHAEEIFKKLGSSNVYRDFALNLGSLPRQEAWQSKPIQDFTLSEKSELLESAEWFAGVREYGLGNQLLSYLMQSESFGKNFEKDKLLFLYAKSCNSMNQPLLAASHYLQVFTLFPKSSYTAQARKNYILSLHYARKHGQVVAEIDKLKGKYQQLAASLQWLRFWSLYLDGQTTIALSVAKATLSRLRDGEERDRYWYWMARILEKKQQKVGAASIYQKLNDSAEHSVYAIYARWRLGFIEKEQQETVSLSARKLATTFGPRFSIDSELAQRLSNTGAGEKELPMSKSVLFVAERLSHIGLENFARKLLRSQNTSKISAEEARSLALLSWNAEDYSLSSSLGRKSSATQWLRSKEKYPQRLMQFKDEKKFEYPLAFAEVVDSLAQELEIDSSLILSVMKAESHFDPAVTSWVGARGLMQIMPGTGARISQIIGFNDFHPDSLYAPEVNVALGSWYLKRLLTYYKGDLIRSVAAYNAGPEAIDRWAQQTPELEIDEFAENIPFGQTHAYVRKVLKFMDTYYRLYAPNAEETHAVAKADALNHDETEQPYVGRLSQGLVLNLERKLRAPQTELEMF